MAVDKTYCLGASLACSRDSNRDPAAWKPLSFLEFSRMAGGKNYCFAASLACSRDSNSDPAAWIS